MSRVICGAADRHHAADAVLSSDNRLYRVGGVAAILGVAIMLVRFTSERFHPMGEPRNEAATFAAYAAHQYWVAAHLVEFLGYALIFGALVVLAWRLHAGRAGGWAVLGAVGAVTSLSLAAALQAVDGVALKIVTDRWAAALPESQELLFESVFVVRQIEAGLAAMLLMVMGLTVFLYGVALVIDEEAPNWLGVLGIAVSPLTVGTGVTVAHMGLDGEILGIPTVLEILLAAGPLLLLIWVVLIARFLFQSSRHQPGHHAGVKKLIAKVGR